MELFRQVSGAVRLSAAMIFLVIGGVVNATLVVASDFPPCPPPADSEYLLLVRGETEEQRDRIQEILPVNNTVLVCSYLDDPVVRAGGFTSLETANSWAQYMTEVEGLQAFVARPPDPEASSPATLTPTETSPDALSASPLSTESTAAGLPAYNPQALTSGFAVLVEYYNHPEVALDVQQLLNRDVGLVVYRQSPYLLAAQSPDAAIASETLRTLNDHDFTSILVDSSQVVLLTSSVASANQLAPIETNQSTPAEAEDVAESND